MFQSRKMKAEQRLELVHVSLMRQKEFAMFAGLFMVGNTSVVDLPITAATNGRDAKYGRAFVDGLSNKELAFLVMHENMHKCYRHLTTWRALYDKAPRVANAACDHVINLQLVEMDKREQFIAFPRDPKTNERMGCYDERFKDMDTKQVFDILMQEAEEGGGEGEEGEEGNDRQGVDVSSMDNHEWDDAKDGMSEQEKQDLEREIDQALRQGGIYAGKVGGTMTREIEELLKPKADWRSALRRFTKTHLKDRDAPSWRRAHKNYLWQDVILPSIIGKRIKHLVIAVDTSGSIVGPMLTMFLSELNRAVKDSNPDRLDIVYWDTDVAGHEVYKGPRDVFHQTNPKGGGGTDPDCVAKFMAEKKLKPDALIMLSDGYMHSNPQGWAGVTVPVLWCIVGNDNYVPPCGQLIKIKD